MDVRDGFLGSIGKTPLIRLRRASEMTGCEILGKAEFLNPGGSVKDRAALAIVMDAVKQGRLKPGGTIVEGTAGNTGIGLALVGNAVGSGGTLGGVSLALKERNPKIKIVLADPEGAALYNYYAHGELKSNGSSITEGIGQGRITKNLEGVVVDDQEQIPDSEALPIIFDLVQNEGLVLGGSSGINVAGAIRRRRGP